MKKLLERFSTLAPTYNVGLTNHLPMMIIALNELGVHVRDIEHIAENYVSKKQIPDLHDDQYIRTPDDEEYIHLVNSYIIAINKNGIDSVVESFLDCHKYLLSSALFHGLIRLYYALKTEDTLQIAQALAYFNMSAFDCQIKTYKYGTLKEFETLKEYRKNLDMKFKSNTTMKRCKQLLEDDYLHDHLFKVEAIEDQELNLLKLFTELYLETRDFYILHVITGFHALFNLKDYFKDYNDVLNNFFLQAQVFLLLNSYKKTFNKYYSSNFEELKEHAQTLLDAHDIKLLYTCYDLYQLFELENLNKIAHYIIKK